MLNQTPEAHAEQIKIMERYFAASRAKAQIEPKHVETIIGYLRHGERAPEGMQWVNTGNCLQAISASDFETMQQFEPKWRIAKPSDLILLPCVRSH